MDIKAKIQSIKYLFLENKPLWITIVALLLAFAGLLSSPLFLLYLASRGWWLFFAMFAIVLLHAITFIPCGYYIAKHNPRSFWIGAFTGIMIFATLFMVFGEMSITYGNRELKNYIIANYLEPDYQFRSFDISAGILTFAISCILPALLYFTITRLFLSDCFDFIDFSIKDKFKIILGVIVSSSIIISINVAFAKLPSIDIKKRNIIIESENAESLKLKLEHKKSTRSLSFDGYALGADKQIIANDTSWHVIDKNNDDRLYYLNEIPDYLDSVFVKRISWDNRIALLYLCFVQSRLMEIDVLSYKDCKDVLKIFIDKYGEPEILKELLDESFYEYAGFKSKINKDTYSWTYKNCSITIRQFYGYISGYESGYYSYSDSKTLICYSLSDLFLIEDLQNKKKLEIQDSIIRKNRYDSIQSIKQKKKQMYEDSIKENNNHLRAKEQI